MKTTLNITPDYAKNEWVLKLKTGNKRKKISGHRLVELLGMSPYAHPISTILSAFGFWEIDDNEYMMAGRNWEKRILDAVANPGYQTFSFEEYKGTCFDNPIFGGLMDAYDPETGIIWEAKLYHYKVTDEKKGAWFQQLAMYWRLWSDMHPGEKIDAGIAYLKKPKTDDSFSKSDVKMEQLPQVYKDTIESKMLKAIYTYERITKPDENGVIEARSPMTKKVTEEIEWFKNKYKELLVGSI